MNVCHFPDPYCNLFLNGFIYLKYVSDTQRSIPRLINTSHCVIQHESGFILNRIWIITSIMSIPIWSAWLGAPPYVGQYAHLIWSIKARFYFRTKKSSVYGKFYKYFAKNQYQRITVWFFISMSSYSKSIDTLIRLAMVSRKITVIYIKLHLQMVNRKC